MSEIWKDVPSQPEIMASSFGRIWVKPTTATMPTGGQRAYHSQPTYGQDDTSATRRPNSPFRKIHRVWRLKKTFKVHQLVCEAFHGEKPSSAHIVLHLDENPSNNKPGNLRWGTRKENQNFPLAIEAFKNRTGEKSPVVIHRRKIMEGAQT